MAEELVPDALWEVMRSRLGYTDEEFAIFRRDPRNARVLQTAIEMAQRTIVFEVIDSRGCNSQHAVGTRFYFSGDGNLLARMSPSKVCAFLLPIMGQMILSIQELWYAGIDPNRLCFKRAGCFDVGILCGGWGRVVVEARVMDREEARRLHASG